MADPPWDGEGERGLDELLARFEAGEDGLLAQPAGPPSPIPAALGLSYRRNRECPQRVESGHEESPPICTGGRLDCRVNSRLLAIGRPEQYENLGEGRV